MKIAVMYSFSTKQEAQQRMADLVTRDYSMIVLEEVEIFSEVDFEPTGGAKTDTSGPVWLVIGMKRD